MEIVDTVVETPIRDNNNMKIHIIANPKGTSFVPPILSKTLPAIGVVSPLIRTYGSKTRAAVKGEVFKI